MQIGLGFCPGGIALVLPLAKGLLKYAALSTNFRNRFPGLFLCICVKSTKAGFDRCQGRVHLVDAFFRPA